jgi:AAA domain
VVDGRSVVSADDGEFELAQDWLARAEKIDKTDPLVIDMRSTVDRMKAEYPLTKKWLVRDVQRRRIFDSGESMVWVQSASREGWRPTMSLVERWTDYMRIRGDGFANVLSQADAVLLKGWKVQPRRPNRSQRLAEQIETYEVEAQAKAAVIAARNPVVPLQLISLDQLMQMPAPEWWVSGVIPKDSVVVVGGDGGVGKSALIVELVARLSTGTPFINSHATITAKTLYVVGEGIGGYNPRFDAVQQAHGLNRERVRLIKEGVNMSDIKSMTNVREIVERDAVGLVIFDTLSTLSTLESENDAAEVARVLNNAKYVREGNPGCTVIIVHHTNKASGGLRGSSVIRDNADMVWMLRGDPDAFFMSNKSKHGGKVKDGEPLEIHGLSLVAAYDSVVVESAGITTEGEAPVDRRANAMAQHFRFDAEYSVADIREIARRDDPNASDATIKRTITALISEGKLMSLERGRYKALAGQIIGGS